MSRVGMPSPPLGPAADPLDALMDEVQARRGGPAPGGDRLDALMDHVQQRRSANPPGVRAPIPPADENAYTDAAGYGSTPATPDGPVGPPDPRVEAAGEYLRSRDLGAAVRGAAPVLPQPDYQGIAGRLDYLRHPTDYGAPPAGPAQPFTPEQQQEAAAAPGYVKAAAAVAAPFAAGLGAAESEWRALAARLQELYHGTFDRGPGAGTFEPIDPEHHPITEKIAGTPEVQSQTEAIAAKVPGVVRVPVGMVMGQSGLLSPSGLASLPLMGPAGELVSGSRLAARVLEPIERAAGPGVRAAAEHIIHSSSGMGAIAAADAALHQDWRDPGAALKGMAEAGGSGITAGALFGLFGAPGRAREAGAPAREARAAAEGQQFAEDVSTAFAPPRPVVSRPAGQLRGEAGGAPQPPAQQVGRVAPVRDLAVNSEGRPVEVDGHGVTPAEPGALAAVAPRRVQQPELGQGGVDEGGAQGGGDHATEPTAEPAWAQGRSDDELRLIAQEVGARDRGARPQLLAQIQERRPPGPVTPEYSKQPEGLRREIDSRNAAAEKAGLADHIESMSADGTSAPEIARQLGTDVPTVWAVRSKRAIPSIADPAEFEAWVAKLGGDQPSKETGGALQVESSGDVGPHPRGDQSAGGTGEGQGVGRGQQGPHAAGAVPGQALLRQGPAGEVAATAPDAGAADRLAPPADQGVQPRVAPRGRRIPQSPDDLFSPGKAPPDQETPSPAGDRRAGEVLPGAGPDAPGRPAGSGRDLGPQAGAAAEAGATAPAEPYKFASTQVNLPDAAAEKVRALGRQIPDAELAEDGREQHPHVTVLYGLHGEDPAPLRKLLAGVEPFEVTLGTTSVFKAKEGKDYDVVKADVQSGELRKLNKAIGDALEHTSKFPVYRPHATVAYVKAGLGEKYAGRDDLRGLKVPVDRIAFTDRQGNQTEIRLGEGGPEGSGEPSPAPRSFAELRAEAKRLGVWDAGTKTRTAVEGRIEGAKGAEKPADSGAHEAHVREIVAETLRLKPGPQADQVVASAAADLRRGEDVEFYTDRFGRVLIASRHSRGTFQTVVRRDGALDPRGSMPVDEARWKRRAAATPASFAEQAAGAGPAEVVGRIRPTLNTLAKQAFEKGEGLHLADLKKGTLEPMAPPTQAEMVENYRRRILEPGEQRRIFDGPDGAVMVELHEREGVYRVRVDKDGKTAEVPEWADRKGWTEREKGTPRPAEAAAAPSVATKLIARLDEVEARALDELKSLRIPRDPSSGATFLPQAAVAYGKVLAARALKAGIRGGAEGARQLRVLADTMAKELGVASEYLGDMLRVARSLLRESRDESGTPAAERFDAALQKLDGSLAAEPASVKAQVREATGQAKPSEAPTVKATAALKGQLAAEAKGARQGFREGVRAAEARAEAPKPETTKQTIERMTGVRPTEEATVSPHQALLSRLRGEEKASAQAARQSRREALAEANNRLATLKGDIQRAIVSERTQVGMTERAKGAAALEREQARTAEMERMRDEAIELVRRHAPMAVRGRLMEAVSRSTTPHRLLGVATRLRQGLAEHEARMNYRDFASVAKGAHPREMLQEYRNIVRKAVFAARALRARLNKGGLPASELDGIAAELKDLWNAVVEARHRQKVDNQITVEGKVRLREQVVRDGVAAIEKRPELPEIPGLPMARRAGLLGRIHQAMLTPDSVGASMRDPVLRRVLSEDLWDGETKVNGDTQRGMDALRKSVEGAGYKWGSDELQRLSRAAAGPEASEVEVHLASGQTLKASPGELMALYATLTDVSAGKNIRGGAGVTFERNKLGEPYKLEPGEDTKIRLALDQIDPALAGIVDRAKKHIEAEVRPGLFAAFREQKGYDLEPAEGYWRTRRNRENAESPGVIEPIRKHLNRALENLGFLKERTPEHKTPYLIGDFFQDYHDIVYQGAVVTHMTRLVRNAEMVFKDKRMRRAIETRFGQGMNRRIDQIVENGKLIFRDPRSGAEHVAAIFNKNLAKALLTVNPRTYGKQLGGVFKLGVYINPADLAAGAKSAYSAEVSAILKDDPYFRNRYQEAIFRRMTPSLGERGAILGQSPLKDAVKRLPGRHAYGALQDLTDRIELLNNFDAVNARMAIAAKLVEGRRLGLKDPAAWAAREAEYAIRRTNNTSSPLDMSGLAADLRGEIASGALMFTSDQNKSYNMLATAWQEGRAPFARALACVALDNAWGAAVTTALGAAGIAAGARLLTGREATRAEDKRAGLGESFVRAFARNAAGTVYFADSVVEAVGRGLDRAFGRRASDSPQLESPLLNVGEDLLTGMAGLVQGAADYGEPFASGPRAGEDKGVAALKAGAIKTIEAVSKLAGIPVSPIARTGATAYRAITAE